MTSAQCYDGPGHDYVLDGFNRNARKQPERDHDGHVETMMTVELRCTRCGSIAKHALWVATGRAARTY